jgi:glutamate decarboxylase
MLRHRGDEEMARRVEAAVDMAAHVADRVAGTNGVAPLLDADGRPCFALATPPQYANCVFFYVPPALRDAFPPAGAAGPAAVAAAVAALSAEDRAALGAAAPMLKDRMQRKGGALIGFQPIGSLDLPNVFRIVFAGDKATALTPAMMDETLRWMAVLAEDPEAAGDWAEAEEEA